MFKKVIALLFVVSLLGCEKKRENVGCGTATCTLSFAMIGVQFKDKNGNGVEVQSLSAINQRTKQSVLVLNKPINNQPGYYYITDDSMRGKFSSEGDEVIVLAVNPATNQTKTATYKISGGCSCHVMKLLGPDTITFD